LKLLLELVSVELLLELLGVGLVSLEPLGLGLLELLGLLVLFLLESLARAGEAMREAPVIAATALAAARGRPRRISPPRSTGNDGCRRSYSSPARYLP